MNYKGGKMKEKSAVRWFVRPRNNYTKDRVGETFGPSAIMEEITIIIKGTLKIIRAWEVEYSIIDYMEKSPDSGYKFEAYRLKKDAKFVEKWLFGKPNKLARIKEVKRVKKELIKRKKI